MVPTMPGQKLSRIVQEQMEKPSPIRQIMKMAERRNIVAMGLNPDDVISFGGGWVNHEAPKRFREIYGEIARDEPGFHRSGGYSATLGEHDCRQKIADMEAVIFGMRNVSEKNIIIGQSSTQVTHDLFVTLMDPGDGIILLDPTYANYPGQLSFACPGHKIHRLKVLDTESWTYVPDPSSTVEEFKAMYGQHWPKVVLFPSPDNPTSQMPPDRLVRAMADVTEDGGSYLAMDFAYKTQYFGEMPDYYSWSPEDRPHVVSLHSNSKWARGLGRRLGWIEASEAVVGGMERVDQCSILCPDTLHQMAMAQYLGEALGDGSLKKYLDDARAAYKHAADVTMEAIDQYLGMRALTPQGGLYTCVDVGEDGDAFVQRVLKNTGVLFIPGKGFGDTLRNAVRISYGPMVNDLGKITEGMERVGKYLRG